MQSSNEEEIESEGRKRVDQTPFWLSKRRERKRTDFGFWLKCIPETKNRKEKKEQQARKRKEENVKYRVNTNRE